MSSAAKHRVEVLPVILYTPYWARVNKRNAYSPPKNSADFTLLLRKLIARYGSKGSFWTKNPELPRKPIRYWQIWNEPNNTIERYWDGRRGSKYAWPRATRLFFGPPARPSTSPIARHALFSVASPASRGEISGGCTRTRPATPSTWQRCRCIPRPWLVKPRP